MYLSTLYFVLVILDMLHINFHAIMDTPILSGTLIPYVRGLKAFT